MPLAGRGREQAQALADGLAVTFDIDSVTASDLRRARETAELLAGPLGVDLTTDDGWREREFGTLQELPTTRSTNAIPSTRCRRSARQPSMPGPRVARAWRSFATGCSTPGTGWSPGRPDETHLVVTHGGPLYLVLGHLLGRTVLESVLESSQANCAVNEVRVDGDRIEVVRENDTALVDR